MSTAITWTTNNHTYFAKIGKSSALMSPDPKSNAWDWHITHDYKLVCGGSGTHKHLVKEKIEKELLELEAKMNSPRFEVRRQYLMGGDEIDFIKSLQKLQGDNEIVYTRAQENRLKAICNRLASMNGHCEWHWMLRSANTTDFKTTKARAMHIYLNTVMDLKAVLTPMEAAYEFHCKLHQSHVWVRELYHNAYTMIL